MNFFKPKPTAKEQQRDVDRQLRKVNRGLERDKNHLQQDEKKLELEIKKMAKAGNKEGCAILAKQLVQLRKQRTRMVMAESKISGVASQNKMMGANMALQGAMATTAKSMGTMNRIMQPAKVAAEMKAFQHGVMRMEMTEEMVNDTLDDILAGSDDEEESDALVTKVLDEIGIEVSGAMANAPTAGRDALGSKQNVTDKSLEEQLAKLRLPE